MQWVTDGALALRLENYECYEGAYWARYRVDLYTDRSAEIISKCYCLYFCTYTDLDDSRPKLALHMHDEGSVSGGLGTLVQEEGKSDHETDRGTAVSLPMVLTVRV